MKTFWIRHTSLLYADTEFADDQAESAFATNAFAEGAAAVQQCCGAGASEKAPALGCCYLAQGYCGGKVATT